MKKLTLLCVTMLVFVTAQAQWVNNPAQNTFIANTSADAGEVYLATNATTGDTYAQWCSFVGGNGWSPTLQRINSEGVPQWGTNGIHIGAHEFSSMSEGVAITTTTDGGVVSCFAVYDGFTYAVKINADGTFPWGEQGVQLFGGLGFSRAEVIATDDGGIWALGFDYQNLYLQYVNTTTGPVVTIHDNGGHKCMFGQLTLGNDNNVFVTYEKLGNGMYTDKEIFVAGYATDGTQISPETLLMSSQTFQSTYIHHAISDGMGGGYVYIWHPAIGSAFNTYVFHFNHNGATTIFDTNGVPVHSTDPANYYGDAYATVDPLSHDLIIAYEKTDAEYQATCSVYVNRITASGERVWNDGVLVLDNGTLPCHDIRVDAYPYGDGFMVAYMKQNDPMGVNAIVEAKGYNENADLQWTTLMNDVYNWKVAAENTSGFHDGQNIMMWVNANTGGLYGQNIGTKGEMGEIIPPTPPTPCYAPTNFQGEYVYTDVMFGAMLSWDAPETTPLHYNLYCEGLREVIEIDAQYTSYFQEFDPGDYIYRLTAVYEDCESSYATTPSGDNYVFIEVTSIPENDDEAIVTLLKVYNMNGQQIRINNTDELSPGVYILQGLTPSGKLVSRKVVMN